MYPAFYGDNSAGRDSIILLVVCVMTKKQVCDTLFAVLSILALLGVLVYPNLVYTAREGAGMSYVLTSVLYALPVVALFLFVQRRWLYCVLVALLAVGSIIDLTMVDLYGDYLLHGAIISTLKTNPQEASEFFHTNLLEALHWIPLIVLCVLACVCYRTLKIRLSLKCIVLAASLGVPTAFVAYKLLVYYSDDARTLRFFVDTHIWNRTPYNCTFQVISAKKNTR